MTPFEGTSTCIETARPLQLLEVLSSVCALVFLSSRSLTSLQTSGGPLTSSRITPDSLLPFVHPPPLSSPHKRKTKQHMTWKPKSTNKRQRKHRPAPWGREGGEGWGRGGELGGGGGQVRPIKNPPGGALKQTRHSLTKNKKPTTQNTPCPRAGGL